MGKGHFRSGLGVQCRDAQGTSVNTPQLFDLVPGRFPSLGRGELAT